MSGNPSPRRKVLLVDDDPAFLEMMERVMSVLSEGAWEIGKAESASQALARLQQGPVDLVTIDVQMPVVDGLQFLALLNRRYPSLTKVVLTGFATEPYRVACLSNGAELFLEKPKTAADQKALVEALTQAMNFRPEEGFRGVLRGVGLPDVIQMECLSAGSSVLEVASAKAAGRIYLQEGAIIHAEAGELQGEDAFHYLLSLRGGEFRLEPFTPPARATIDAPWEFLLMESARKRDEGAMAAAPWSVVGGPASEAPEVAAAADLAPVPMDAPPSGTEAPTAAAVRRTTEEVLVCSSDGIVLREWRVSNTERWISFIEFLSQKARRIARGLPVGNLERFEAAGHDQRLLTVIGSGHAVLVRCREENE